MANESGARGLKNRDLALDGLQSLTVVDHCRGSFEAVVAVTSRDRVGGLRSEVVATLLVDALALVASVVHPFLASEASHGFVRELGPFPPRVLDPLTSMERPTLLGTALRRVGWVRS